MSDTVMVSGGFDPLHVGHLALLEGASLHGRVIVALNSDHWLEKKKFYVFMSWEERARILSALTVVDTVTPVADYDDTICEALQCVRPTYFANGGDRTEAAPQEHAMCEELGIKELFNVGGPKIQSSEELTEAAGRRVSYFNGEGFE